MTSKDDDNKKPPGYTFLIKKAAGEDTSVAEGVEGLTKQIEALSKESDERFNNIKYAFWLWGSAMVVLLGLGFYAYTRIEDQLWQKFEYLDFKIEHSEQTVSGYVFDYLKGKKK